MHSVADEARELAALRREADHLRDRFLRARTARDRWRDRSLIFEKACAQLQAALQTLQAQAQLGGGSGKQQSLDSIWCTSEEMKGSAAGPFSSSSPRPTPRTSFTHAGGPVPGVLLVGSSSGNDALVMPAHAAGSGGRGSSRVARPATAPVQRSRANTNYVAPGSGLSPTALARQEWEADRLMRKAGSTPSQQQAGYANSTTRDMSSSCVQVPGSCPCAHASPGPLNPRQQGSMQAGGSGGSPHGGWQTGHGATIHDKCEEEEEGDGAKLLGPEAVQHGSEKGSKVGMHGSTTGSTICGSTAGAALANPGVSSSGQQGVAGPQAQAVQPAGHRYSDLHEAAAPSMSQAGMPISRLYDARAQGAFTVRLHCLFWS